MFRYECSNGHYIEANDPVVSCPCFRRGHPCDGDLRSKGKRTKDEAATHLVEALTEALS